MENGFVRIAAYPTYEEANDNQHTLLSYEIDCVVRMPGQGFFSIRQGELPEYFLLVSEEDAERALDLITRPVAEDYQPLVKCPYCSSGEKKEVESSFLVGLFLFILLIPLFIDMLLLRIKGRKYQCQECQQIYRYNFRNSKYTTYQ